MSSSQHGRPVYGTLHAATLTTAELVVLFEAGQATSGGATAITPASDERLSITDVWFISDTVADIHVYMSDDNDGTAETGETLLRGSVAANGGISKAFHTPRVGAAGADVRATSTASAIVDIGFTGYITKA